MAPFRAKSSGGKSGNKSGFRRAGDDAFKLTVDYLKQEALDPLKGLGRFLLWGVAGSLAIAVGILLLLVGILRLLQTETGTALTGNWSWVPYFAVALIGLGVAGVSAWRITAGPGKRKVPKSGSATSDGAKNGSAMSDGAKKDATDALGTASALGTTTALGTKEGSS